MKTNHGIGAKIEKKKQPVPRAIASLENLPHQKAMTRLLLPWPSLRGWGLVVLAPGVFVVTTMELYVTAAPCQTNGKSLSPAKPLSRPYLTRRLVSSLSVPIA